MVNRIVELSLRHRVLVIGLAVALAGWGWWAATATPIDAIPDLSDNQVIVFTDWSGHSAQEVEDQVSYPLTVNLRGLAGVRVVRSQSAFGFSMIYVVFEDNVDQYFARSRVLERLSLVSTQMPEGAVPTLGPDATGVGHVFWYTVESDRHSLRDLRSLQDWFIRYQLNAVPGVAEVASVGGHVQQYQIDIDPNRLRAYNLSLGAVVEAVRDSNQNVGGNVLEANGTWSIVRGVGLIESVQDLEQIVVSAPAGVPVYVHQLGQVHVGDAFRVASLVKGRDEAVGGVIVMRSGANAQEVIDAVKARIAQISPGLPAGVRIVPFYDRSTLICAVGRHVTHGAHRGDCSGHAGARDLPDALSIDPHRHAAAAARGAHLLHRDVLPWHLVEHHEPCGNRDRDRRTGRRGHRRDRERVPVCRASRHRHARSSRRAARRCSNRLGSLAGPSSSRWRSSCSRSFPCSR